MPCMNDAANSPKIEPSEIPGVLLISVPTFSDHRGVFEPAWDVETFESLGIPFRPEGAAHSYNRRAGTIRAFPYQSAPFAQAKLVSCVSGSIWDVAVDLRQDSSTFGRWSAVHLSEASGSFHLIPAGCAHGFLTLTDASTVSYLIEGPYRPEAARTLRWNDPEIRVPWPVEDPILSEKDRNAPFLNHPQPPRPE